MSELHHEPVIDDVVKLLEREPGFQTCASRQEDDATWSLAFWLARDDPHSWRTLELIAAATGAASMDALRGLDDETAQRLIREQRFPFTVSPWMNSTEQLEDGALCFEIHGHERGDPEILRRQLEQLASDRPPPERPDPTPVIVPAQAGYVVITPRYDVMSKAPFCRRDRDEHTTFEEWLGFYEDLATGELIERHGVVAFGLNDASRLSGTTNHTVYFVDGAGISRIATDPFHSCLALLDPHASLIFDPDTHPWIRAGFLLTDSFFHLCDDHRPPEEWRDARFAELPVDYEG